MVSAVERRPVPVLCGACVCASRALAVAHMSSAGMRDHISGNTDDRPRPRRRLTFANGLDLHNLSWASRKSRVATRQPPTATRHPPPDHGGKCLCGFLDEAVAVRKRCDVRPLYIPRRNTINRYTTKAGSELR